MSHIIKTIRFGKEEEIYNQPYSTELAEILKEIWDNRDFITQEDLTNLGFFSKKSYLDEYKLIKK